MVWHFFFTETDPFPLKETEGGDLVPPSFNYSHILAGIPLVRVPHCILIIIGFCSFSSSTFSTQDPCPEPL